MIASFAIRNAAYCSNRCMIKNMSDTNHTAVFVARLLVMIFILAGCWSTQPEPPVLLQDTLTNKQISATFRGSGSYGNIVVVALTSNFDQSRRMVVTPGSLLRNSTATRSSLVLVAYKGDMESPVSAYHWNDATDGI